MKIGFDVSQTGQRKSGCGYFADSLIQAIAQLDQKNQYILYRTFGDFYWDPDYKKIQGVKRANFTWGNQHGGLDEARFFWRQPLNHILKELSEPNILHINNYFCPEKKIPETKLVYTLYDLSFMDYPEWATEQNRVLCCDNIFNASLWADHMIAISEYSKQHFLEMFPHYSEKKITVIPLASRYHYCPELEKPEDLSQLMTGQFFLSVGTIEPRKNHQLLLQAYACLKASHKKIFPLVLVGGMGWMMEDFDKLLVELNIKEDVILLGYASDQTLQWLYQNCFCFIYPSLFEGFGLPVLEAMSCKAPVITSNTSSIPEITGTEAALLIDPYNLESLVEAMKNCLENKIDVSELAQKGLERSKNFTWEKSAEKVLDVYACL